MNGNEEEPNDERSTRGKEGKDLIARLETQEERCTELAQYLFGHIIKHTSAHVNEQCSSLIESSKESIRYVPFSRNTKLLSHKELIPANVRFKYWKSISNLCWSKPQSSTSSTAHHLDSSKASAPGAGPSPQIAFQDLKNIIHDGSHSSTSFTATSADSNQIPPPSASTAFVESSIKQKSKDLPNSYYQSVLTAKTRMRQRKQTLKEELLSCEYPLFEKPHSEPDPRLSHPILGEIDEFSRKSSYALKESIKSVFPDTDDDTETDSDWDEPDDDFECGDDGGEEYEGNDESQKEHDNRPFKYLPVEESPKAIWAKDRGDHLSRHHYLQYRLEELAAKKKRDTELLNEIRSNKPLFTPGESSTTPTNDNSTQPEPISSRCHPLNQPFGQRKIFQVGGIHNLMPDSKRETTINCDCRPQVDLCILCTGKPLTVHRTNNDLKSRKDVNTLLNQSYHKNLTSRRDLGGSTRLIIQDRLSKDLQGLSIKNLERNRIRKVYSRLPIVNSHIPGTETLLEYVMRMKQGQPVHNPVRPIHTTIINRVVKRKRGRYIKIKRSRPRPSNSNRNRRRDRRKKLRAAKMDDSDVSYDGEEEEEGLTASSNKKKGRKDTQDFDINRIVIPHSIAASTRVEKLTYKEIVTPTWRTFDDYKAVPVETEDLNGEDVEDISEKAIQARHEIGLIEEAEKFLKNSSIGNRGYRLRSRNRGDSNNKNSDPNTPDLISDPASPQPQEFNNNNWEIPSGSNAETSELKCNPPKRRSSRRINSYEEDEMEEDDDDLEEGFTPFEPRIFPLSSEEYEAMKRMMPANF